MEAGRDNGLDAALLDRLALDEGRVTGIADGVRAIAALPDPVGEVIDGHRLPNGLDVARCASRSASSRSSTRRGRT